MRCPIRSSVLLVGDLNTSSSEPGRTIVADGLHDAHAEAGTGTGFTWRPSSLEALGLGFLRIDAVLTGAWLRPTAVEEDCRLAGDHCRLYATLVVEAAQGRSRRRRSPRRRAQRKAPTSTRASAPVVRERASAGDNAAMGRWRA